MARQPVSESKAKPIELGPKFFASFDQLSANCEVLWYRA
jgi:hypothetical protein